MSVKKSKVVVNNVLSSDEEVESGLDLDDINGANDSDFDGIAEDIEGSATTSKTETNSGWADAINKVLSVKTKNKSFILSKAKKDKDLKRQVDETTDDLEIVGTDGTVVKSWQKTKKQKTEANVGEKGRNKSKLSKVEWEVMNKLKPKAEDRDRERLLCSIATKGVVQLFNAVRQQQTAIESKLNEVGSSETRRDKMMTQFNKNQFLDKLKQKDNSNKSNKSNESDKKDTEEQKWRVLRDDFMIGAKMKDWDKESDSDEESDH
ncbi:unnamed protein product [Oppiella nova]|uniref:RRP15-like protein n=1 Tax=Oppiella nova TaxID=334625 RepID=A0A7R9QGR0_9ACAR|nr:unnamed protein product [Oppiella nova]CAG2165611.1 unnamed protein product [Oppiella nova]